MLRHILKYRICTQQIIEIWLSILLSMLHKTVILLSSLYISVSSQVTGDTVFTRSLSLPGLLCSICPLWCRIATSSLTWSLGSLQMRLEIYDKLICYFVYRELGLFFFLLFAHVYISPATLCSTSKLFWCYRSRCIKFKARTIASFVRYFVL